MWETDRRSRCGEAQWGQSRLADFPANFLIGYLVTLALAPLSNPKGGVSCRKIPISKDQIESLELCGVTDIHREENPKVV